MNKSTLKAEFINAKIKDAKYIGVSIKTEGSSQPEIIINPRENFDAKFDYYMEAYDDDLILIAANDTTDTKSAMSTEWLHLSHRSSCSLATNCILQQGHKQ